MKTIETDVPVADWRVMPDQRAWGTGSIDKNTSEGAKLMYQDYERPMSWRYDGDKPGSPLKTDWRGMHGMSRVSGLRAHSANKHLFIRYAAPAHYRLCRFAGSTNWVDCSAYSEYARSPNCEGMEQEMIALSDGCAQDTALLACMTGQPQRKKAKELVKQHAPTIPMQAYIWRQIYSIEMAKDVWRVYGAHIKRRDAKRRAFAACVRGSGAVYDHVIYAEPMPSATDLRIDAAIDHKTALIILELAQRWLKNHIKAMASLWTEAYFSKVN